VWHAVDPRSRRRGRAAHDGRGPRPRGIRDRVRGGEPVDRQAVRGGSCADRSDPPAVRVRAGARRQGVERGPGGPFARRRGARDRDPGRLRGSVARGGARRRRGSGHLRLGRGRDARVFVGGGRGDRGPDRVLRARRRRRAAGVGAAGGGGHRGGVGRCVGNDVGNLPPGALRTATRGSSRSLERPAPGPPSTLERMRSSTAWACAPTS
jgi:hypothetical protein